MTDNDIIKALECCKGCSDSCNECPFKEYRVYVCECMLNQHALDLINRQKAEIERLRKAPKCLYEQETDYRSLSPCYNDEGAEEVRNATIKEFAEKIDELFNRYAHLHKYADSARTDYIELASGEECEMQSVWDVITLNKNGLVEYETMYRLQDNIETIVKARLLAEIQKDFKCLVKKMVGERE